MRAPLIMAVVLIAAAFFCAFAFAHDHERPGLTDWFQSLRNKNAVPCCDGHDAKKLEDVDWKADGKTYSVRLDGRWVDVPEEAVLDGPNKEGQALVWTYNNRILCFMPGAGT